MKDKRYLWPLSQQQVYRASLFAVFLLMLGMVFMYQEYSSARREADNMRAQYMQLLTNLTFHAKFNNKPEPPDHLR